ncbi:MAG: tRNA lysidine(34) synthetase TilS [Hyphomonadaceae bacterium]|nr:tRNA lysidine(34) synthetase TilS [Hyphomonadaceae bacterium]
MLDRLTIERLSACEGPIVVALSGGGDSVALLALLAQRVDRSRLHAVIVDHALRAGSADEASKARTIAVGLGVDATIQTLTWPDSPTAGQGAARAGRYRALASAARRLGARAIATAHTRDDQAETILLRSARGSSWRGLAGMRAISPVPIWPEGRGLWLARPLLGVRRWALRALLQERGLSWIEDPSNANEAFARVRVRRWLEDAERAGFGAMRLAKIAERLAPHADALDHAALSLIRDCIAFHDQTALLTRSLWRGSDKVRQRALSVVVTAAGGAGSEPPPDQVADLEAQLLRPDFKAATLSGALIKGGAGLKWGAGTVAVRRDRGAIEGRADGAPVLPPLAITTSQAAIWDNRLEVCVAEPGWSVVADAKGPHLARGGERRGFTEAEAKWLLEERVLHLLGQI